MQGFGLGVNPEFLTEGQAVTDFMDPDRIVIGGIDERTLRHLSDVYAAFTDVPIISTNNTYGRDDQVRVERAAGDHDLFRQ